jgi:hypothetical protein
MNCGSSVLAGSSKTTFLTLECESIENIIGHIIINPSMKIDFKHGIRAYSFPVPS